MKISILEIGPSPYKSKGGMATVINQILESTYLADKYHIDVYESYRDGSILFRILYSIKSYLRFKTLKKTYSIYHIHMASYGSTYRKGLYIKYLKRKKSKIILHVHGAEYLKFYKESNAYKKKKIKKLWEACDAVIVLSEQWKKEFVKIFSGCNIYPVKNGINNKIYEDCIVDLKYVSSEFLFLGRLGERKGIYDLIDAIHSAINENNRIHCYIAGDGEIDKVSRIIQEKKLESNCTVLGWIGCQEKKAIFSKIGTVILPSYNEGLPMTIIEGMAAGKVIISTEVGAIPEVVKNKENGILIKPGDVNSLRDAILRISSDKAFDQYCSKMNIGKIQEEYSNEIFSKSLSEVFDNVLGK